jgi:hypothetical protein
MLVNIIRLVSVVGKLRVKESTAVPNSNGNTEYKYIGSIVHIGRFELGISESLTCF